MDQTKKPSRTVNARRTVALGGVAAVAIASAAPASAGFGVHDVETSDRSFLLAQAEGEGEGAATASAEGEGEGEGEGGGNLAPDIAFLRDLGFMTGHMRAGIALYEKGDLAAAKTHLGHPIEEKYDAVADRLASLGFADMRDDIVAVADAAENEADASEVRRLFDAAMARVEEARAATGSGPGTQMMALAALTRVAADEYDIALTDGDVTNLHEYQDSWGFLRTVEQEAGQFAQSDDAAVAEAAEAILTQVDATADAFGNLQGEGISNPDAAILYGAAARMEIAAMGLSN